MTRRLHLRAEAEDELIEASAWYEEQCDGLGGEFLDELDAMLQRIARTPLQFPRIK